MPVTTVRAAVAAIEKWSGRGIVPSTIHITVDALTTLRRFIEPTVAEGD